VNEKEELTPKCPSCGATANQFLYGWNEEWTRYRCEHCKKVYKREDEANG